MERRRRTARVEEARDRSLQRSSPSSPERRHIPRGGRPVFGRCVSRRPRVTPGVRTAKRGKSRGGTPGVVGGGALRVRPVSAERGHPTAILHRRLPKGRAGLSAFGRGRRSRYRGRRPRSRPARIAGLSITVGIALRVRVGLPHGTFEPAQWTWVPAAAEDGGGEKRVTAQVPSCIGRITVHGRHIVDFTHQHEVGGPGRTFRPCRCTAPRVRVPHSRCRAGTPTESAGRHRNPLARTRACSRREGGR